MRLPSAAGTRRQSALVAHMLSGGDRRSIAKANDVCDLVIGRLVPVSAVVGLTVHADPLVAMRAFDVLEKIARVEPELLRSHRHVFLRRRPGDERWEIQLQIVRALPLLRWTARERARAKHILLQQLEHPQPFVRAWALDGLVTLAHHDHALTGVLTRNLLSFERSRSRALKARARHIRARLSRRPARPRVRG